MTDNSFSSSILEKFNKRKRKADSEFVGWKEKSKEHKQKLRKWAEEKEMAKIQKRIDKEKKTKDDDEEIRKEREELGRDWTVSIALPGSIIDNAQSDELRTYVAGQVARAATVFCVDEIIVFDEMKSTSRNEDGEIVNILTNKRRNGCIMLAKVLQYLECPQYLRKAFFPPQPDLKFAGLLNPLDAPHHLRADVWCDYREGVVLNKMHKEGQGSFVDIGLKKECQIDKVLVNGARVTVKIDPNSKEQRHYKGVAVSPHEPRLQQGRYWGYKTRLCTCLSEVINGCPYKEGYDMTIGTSERGDNVDNYSLPKRFKHLLIVFGGVKGLEAALESDDNISHTDPKDMFDSYLNTCPTQGSGTIRTEEALLVSLSVIRPKIQRSQAKAPS